MPFKRVINIPKNHPTRLFLRINSSFSNKNGKEYFILKNYLIFPLSGNYLIFT